MNEISSSKFTQKFSKWIHLLYKKREGTENVDETHETDAKKRQFVDLSESRADEPCQPILQVYPSKKMGDRARSFNPS